MHNFALLNQDITQYMLVDGIGHFILLFLINTNNNLDIVNFSDDFNDNNCTQQHPEDFKKHLLINLLNFIKRINII